MWQPVCNNQRCNIQLHLYACRASALKGKTTTLSTLLLQSRKHTIMEQLCSQPAACPAAHRALPEVFKVRCEAQQLVLAG
jgi:hypothetical protein